jgi:hypothetical protein
MSALNLGPAPDRSRTPAILIAVLVLAAIAAVIYHFSPRTPAQVQVVKVDIFAPHTETQAAKGAIHVLGTPAYVEDNLYVVVHISIENKLRQTLFLESPTATLTLPEGTTPATVVNPTDFPRLAQSFPALTPLATHPLGEGSEVAPRATQDGSVVLLFSTLKQSDWQSKKSATLTINLHNLPPQTITIP